MLRVEDLCDAQESPTWSLFLCRQLLHPQFLKKEEIPSVWTELVIFLFVQVVLKVIQMQVVPPERMRSSEGLLGDPSLLCRV